MNHFRDGSILIHLGPEPTNIPNKNNNPSQIAEKSPTQPKTNHFFLIKIMQTKRSKIPILKWKTS